MPAQLDTMPAADFQNIPLETIIFTPLTAVVKAQLATSLATRDYIKCFLKNPAGANGTSSTVYEADTVEFKSKYSTTDPGTNATAIKDIQISVPLLAIVPIPHLRISSLKNNFKYSVTQTVRDAKETAAQGEMEVGASATLSWLVKASLKGSISSKSSSESAMNRSGTLDITVEAGESEMPEGLAKLMNLLSNSIIVQPVQPAQSAQQ